MEFVLFQIQAPIISYGNVARGDLRSSDNYPSKSAITGLIGSALGIRYEDTDRALKLANALSVNVEVHSYGDLLVDYHTIQTIDTSVSKIIPRTRKDEIELATHKTASTKVTNREYYTESLFVVSVYLKNDDFTLDEIVNAINYPTFPLFIGRKACVPSSPLAPRKIEADTLLESFNKYEVKIVSPYTENDPQWMQDDFDRRCKTLYFKDYINYHWESDCEFAGMKPTTTRIKHDVPVSIKPRLFGKRTELKTTLKRSKEI